ncbi:MAG: type I-C CRISPR-associated protein Cas8c/Csd1 [Planctomycetes bacterium]|nr:type I-C CRISPR-associated protein Cas8c/Csd1 [Planctomycetota bacterium]
MILTRLYELATRPGETILDDPAFENSPIPYVVMLDKDGGYISVEERRGKIVTPSKKKGAPPKEEPDKGNVISVPRAHGNTASQGFARYFADTLPRVLLTIHDLEAETDQTKKKNEIEKRKRNFVTFWEQIRRAATETDDPALKAVAAFGKRLTEDTTLAQRVRFDVAAKEPDAGDRCTFAWYPDNGTTILDVGKRKAARDWFANILAGVATGKQDAGPIGLCQVTGIVGPLPTSHPIKLQGVPGGLPTGVSLVSFDKDAFQHYGLDKAANAGIGYRATDAYCRALAALISGTVAGNKVTKLRVGGTLFLFWTREPANTDWMTAMFESADTDSLKAEFESVGTGKKSNLDPNPNEFYVLALSGNAARAVVRDYLERPLGRVKQAARNWFNDLRIADTSKEFQGKPNDRFPLWLLANATALESDRVAPDTHTRLIQAALTGGPLPDSVLAACLGRLRAEGSEGLRASRLALIKLSIKRKGIPVSETLNPDERHPAYVYGRMLEVFAQIQYAALGDVNANVVDKFYGTFSAAPAMVFGRLMANAQNHLRKIRGEKPGTAVVLDQRLTEVRQLLTAAPPPVQFSLQDQGRFALGYYHEKAKRFEQIADVKAEKAKKAGQVGKPTES